MATITNARDIILQATSPRLLQVDTNRLTLLANSNTFTTLTGGSSTTPTSIDINYFLTGVLTGTPDFSILPATAYTVTATGINILGTSIPVGTSIVVTATLSFLGVNYTATTTINRTTVAVNAISAILSRETVTLPADSTGAITSYTNSGTELRVYDGSILIPYNEAGYTGGTNNTWKVTTVVSNITAGTKTDSGSYASWGVASGIASGTPTSSITFTIEGRTSGGTLFTIVKVQTFSKAVAAPVIDVSGLLSKTANNILTGTIVPQDTGAIKVGSILWNVSTGALTGGSGIAITEWGIIGAKAGNPMLTMDISGNAIFLGDLTTGGDVYAFGKNSATETYSIGGTAYNVDYSVLGKAESDTTALIVRAGVVGHSKAATSKYNIGILGYGIGTLNGIGVVGVGGWFGGWFMSDNTGGVGLKAKNTASSYEVNMGGYSFALQVLGPMTISSTARVVNLNADTVDGYHAASLCSVVTTNTGTCTVAGNGYQLLVTGTLGSTVRTRGTSNIVYIENISDIRKKQDIVDEDCGLEFIRKIRPVRFRMRNDPTFLNHGFIAQELHSVMKTGDDSLAQPNPDGIYGVDYNGITAVLTKAIQEQDLIIQTLTNRIKRLENLKENHNV